MNEETNYDDLIELNEDYENIRNNKIKEVKNHNNKSTKSFSVIKGWVDDIHYNKEDVIIEVRYFQDDKEKSKEFIYDNPSDTDEFNLNNELVQLIECYTKGSRNKPSDLLNQKVWLIKNKDSDNTKIKTTNSKFSKQLFKIKKALFDFGIINWNKIYNNITGSILFVIFSLFSGLLILSFGFSKVIFVFIFLIFLLSTGTISESENNYKSHIGSMILLQLIIAVPVLILSTFNGLEYLLSESTSNLLIYYAVSTVVTTTLSLSLNPFRLLANKSTKIYKKYKMNKGIEYI